MLEKSRVIRCVLATSVERKTEGDYPNAQTEYLEVLREWLGSHFCCVEIGRNVTL